MFLYSQRSCTQSKILPDKGTLLNGILRAKLLNSPFAFQFLINLDFLLPHYGHFDNIIVLLLLVFETLGFMFFVYFLHLTQ